MGYLFAVRSGRGGFLYEYEMRYITRKGKSCEEKRRGGEAKRRGRGREGWNGQDKARQGRGIVRYLYLVYFFYPLVLLTFPILFSVEGGPGKKAKRER